MRYKSGFAMLILSMAFAATAAAAPVWTVNSLTAIGCANGITGFTTTNTGVTGVQRWRTIVDAGGLRYMDEDAGTASNGVFPWHLYNSSSGGPTTAVFPLPPNIPITVDFEYIAGVAGPVVFQRRITLSQCNGGIITNDVVLIGGDVPVPTLGEWGMLALGVLLALAGGVGLRRRPADMG